MLKSKAATLSSSAQVASASLTTRPTNKRKDSMKKSLSAKVPRRVASTASTDAELRSWKEAAQLPPSSTGEVYAEQQYYWRESSESEAQAISIPVTLLSSFKPFDWWIGEMRSRYRSRRLPFHLSCALESIPGWSWQPTTKEAVFAVWAADTEREFEEAGEHWTESKLVAFRIEQLNTLRTEWMADPAIDAQVLTKLASLGDDDWLYLKFDVAGTFRLTAARMLAKTVGADRPDRYDDDEEIAQTSRYTWLLGYLRAYHRIEIPAEEYSHLSDHGNRYGREDEDLLPTEVAAKLRQLARI